MAEDSKANEDRDYGDLYSEIVAGKTRLVVPTLKETLFFRHPSHVDQSGLRAAYARGLEEAKKGNIPTEDEMIQRAIENKWWTKDKESEINTRKEFITRLKGNLARVILPSQKEQIQKSIQNEERALSSLLEERSGLVSYTAETYAVKKLDEFYLLNLVYRDSNLTDRYCTEEDLEILEEWETAPVSVMVSISLGKFKNEKIKKLSATPFFQGLLRLCQDDSAIDFYGKPVVQLSIYQSDLFCQGNFYKKMIKNATERIPEYVFESPESLIAWCEAGSSSASVKQAWESDPNAQKGGERSGRMSSLVGATNSDYKQLGLKDSKKSVGKSLLQLAKEKGGRLSLADLVKNTE